MNEYMKSHIWKSCFESGTEHKDAQEMLKNCYINMRKRAETLVGQIAKDIPSLTVHDITHLNALWENASLIAGDDCEINPMEAFVLGGSILLHDAAMSLAAFSNRKEELKNTPQWKDAVVELDAQLTEEEVEAKVVPTVLRLLHAEQAEELPKVEWKLNGGDTAYIIENSEIRDFYGEIIGQIARSHWLSVKEVESEFASKVVPAGEGIPSEWTVDALKIACLLRCADASHIDASRAPSFLWALLEPKGVSHHHWAFQNKIGKVRVQKHSLVIASGSSFKESEVESWWLAYDVALMVDKELRQVDMLLETLGKKQFKARKVANVESPEHFAKKLGTKGWFPVDASLKITRGFNSQVQLP